MIPLSTVGRVGVWAADASRCIFVVPTPDRDYFFRASSPRARNVWLAALQCGVGGERGRVHV